jgi:hypothetical protein
MRKRTLRSVLVAAFSAVVAFGVLSGPAGAKGDVRADSSWGPVVGANSVEWDSSWGPVVGAGSVGTADSSWG